MRSVRQKTCPARTMAGTGRRRCRSSSRSTANTRRTGAEDPSEPDGPARLPGRPIMRLAWLGLSTGFTCCLSSRAQAFVVQTPIRSAGGLHVRCGRRETARGTCLMSERRGLWPHRPRIDLRSDTVTQPTSGMRKAMHKVSCSRNLRSRSRGLGQLL